MQKVKALLKHHIPHWDIVVCTAILFYFLVKICFFAFSITPGISPDETYHIELSLIYKDFNGLMPPNAPETYHLEVINHKPYLYYLVMGKLLHLNVFDIPPVLFLRFINVLIGMITMIISYKFFRLLTDDKLITLTSLAVLTNIPMYTFLSAFVNYDNLANLFAALSLYTLFRFLRSRETKHLIWAAIFVLSGSLTKYTLLPFALIFAVLCLLDFLIQQKHKSPFLRSSLKSNQPVLLLLTGLFVALLVLNAHLYAVNFYKFRAFIPECTQVLTLEQCLQSKTYYANHWYEQLAKNIPRSNFLPFFDYLFPWFQVMKSSVFGILGHQIMFRHSKELLLYNVLILAFLFSFVRKFKFKDNTLTTYCALAACLYLMLLCAGVNYPSYLRTGAVEANLQGRYAFPVIYPIVFLMTYFLLAYLKQMQKIILAVLIAAIFIWGDLPYFVTHADRSWYANDKLADPWELSAYSQHLRLCPESSPNCETKM